MRSRTAYAKALYTPTPATIVASTAKAVKSIALGAEPLTTLAVVPINAPFGLRY
ncbi:MAG TPA: hypothetical protein VGJ18_12555 [Gemmatimonadaceae bacterium]